MAYNTRRSGGETINNVGARRNPSLQNNFVQGGQLAPQNRQQHPRLQGPPHSNGNFRPQQQRMPGMQQQRPSGPIQQKNQPLKMQSQQPRQLAPQQQQPRQPPPQQQQQPRQPQQQQQQPPPQQQQPPPQQQKPPPQQQQPPPQQQQPPTQQQSPSQQQQAPVVLQDPNDVLVKGEEQMEVGEQGKRKPFWAIRAGKISRKERQRRRNVRLSKILQPKNAVVILNELVKSATYTVSDLPQPTDMNQYTATVLVDGVSHIGLGRSKMDAKSMAAENALKYIVKNRQFSALKKDEEAEEKMEISEDGTPTLPWQHVASFALFKLLHSWGEDPNQARGLPSQTQDNSAAQPPQNRPAKKMPDNAAHMNPLMLLNQMLPHAQFEELGRTGNPPNVVFTFKCTVESQSFTGTGPNKKSAKKMAAFAVCHKILGIQYPSEIYAPTN